MIIMPVSQIAGKEKRREPVHPQKREKEILINNFSYQEYYHQFTIRIVHRTHSEKD